MPRSVKVDDNSWAASFVETATGEPKPTGLVEAALKRIAAEEAGSKNPAAVALGRLGGAKGGKARAAALTAKERSDIARKGAEARWQAKRDAALGLTPKESEVLAMVRDGRTGSEIAKSLGLKSAAVESARKRILERMKVKRIESKPVALTK